MKQALKVKLTDLLSAYILLTLFSYFFFLRLTQFIPAFVVFIPLTLWLAKKPWTLKINSKARVLGIAFGFELLLSLAVFVIHHPADSYFIPFWGARLAFLLFWLVTLKAAPNLENIGKLLETLAVLFIVHAGITWLMYFFPGFRSAVLGTQFLTEMAKASYAANSYGQRLTSVGVMFFGGGAFYGCVCCLLLIYASEKAKEWWPWLAVVTLTITGALIARTALVGVLIGLAFLLYQDFQKNIMRILGFALALSLGFVGLWANPKTSLLVSNALDPLVFQPVLQHFHSLMRTDALPPAENRASQALPVPSTTVPAPTSSTTLTTVTTTTTQPPVVISSTSEMITAGSKAIESTDLKTWLFGTGKVFSETGYYGGTDIGYLRLPYYGGILYCIAFFLPVALCFFYVRRKPGVSRLQSKILLAILILQLVFNLKGIIDLSVFYIAFFMTESSRETSQNTESF